MPGNLRERTCPGQHVARHVEPDKTFANVPERCTATSMSNAMKVVEDLLGPRRRHDDAGLGHREVAEHPSRRARARERHELKAKLGVRLAQLAFEDVRMSELGGGQGAKVEFWDQSDGGHNVNQVTGRRRRRRSIQSFTRRARKEICDDIGFTGNVLDISRELSDE